MCISHSSLTSKRSYLSEISLALSTTIGSLRLGASFIENGGDSLAAMQLLACCRRLGVRLSLNSIFGLRTLLELSEEMEVKAMQSCCCGHESSLESSVCGEHPENNLKTQPYSESKYVRDVSRTCRSYPMTEMQWILVQSTLMHADRNVITYCETHRPEDLPLLKKAWRFVLNLEPIFRMEFGYNDSGGYMVEREDVSLVWEEKTVDSQAEYQQAVEGLGYPDPSLGIRFVVVTLKKDEREIKSAVIWQVHHAFIDGVSASLVRNKVRQFCLGEAIQPGVSFVAFSESLHALQRSKHDETVAFWDQQNKRHLLAATEIVLPRPSTRSYQAYQVGPGQVYVHFDQRILTNFGRTAGVTTTSLYYAAWALVLARYTDSDNVCFGIVLSGRSLPIKGIDSVIGPVLNTLPLYISVDNHGTFQQYAQTVFNSVLGLLSFPWSTPAHGFTRSFHTAVNIRSATCASLDDRDLRSHTKILSDIPLQVEVGDNGSICLSFDTEIFTEPQVKRLGDALLMSLGSIVTPDLSISSFFDASIGSHGYRELAEMGNWNLTTTTLGSVTDDLVSLFIRTAAKYPSEIAIQYPGGVLTYAQLHTQSSKVAYHLSIYVKPGDVVCVHADRSVNWIVAIYGVLKIGAAYCPLDQDLPKAVRTNIYDIAGAKIFLTTEDATKFTQPSSAINCLSVEECLREDTPVVDFHNSLPMPNRTAYVCFTSGSTGKPKGVMCQHQGVVACQQNFHTRLCARPGWKIAQIMSPGFDGSIHEIFSALSYGSTLVMKNSLHPFAHLRAADTAILTPSWAETLDVDEFPNLKVVYFVGEAVPQRVSDIWAEKKQLFNMYGPTETTCGATIKRLVVNKPVTLGGPNPSIRVYILDKTRRLRPHGTIGEVYIAGIQVSAGYVANPDQTARRFFPDTINPQYKRERMYQTGDRGYWSENGELVFVGRQDRQIKLRGFRIDLDDLESRIMLAHRFCTAAAVVLKDDYLIALVQPATLDISALKLDLNQHIPGYALVRYIWAVDSFPTSGTGKLDYKAIASISPMIETQEVDFTVEQKQVTSAIAHVLGVAVNKQVDLDTNIADMGLSSIDHFQLANRLSREFKRTVPLQILLKTTTLRNLASKLKELEDSGRDLHTIKLGHSSVSPIEEEWCHKYDRNSNTTSFNVTYACYLPESVHNGKLAAAWNQVLSRHQILRSRYVYSSGQRIQRQFASTPPTSTLLEDVNVEAEINTPFNLEKDDLIRVLISPNQMLVVASHILCDLTALQQILCEVVKVYKRRPLSNFIKSYSETVWSTPASPSDLAFWSDCLGNLPRAPLPIGNNSLRKSWSGKSHISTIPEHIYQQMQGVGIANQISMHQLALAATALVLQHREDVCDIVLGAPYLNRKSEADFQIVGLFLEPLPIRIRYPYTFQGSGEHKTNNLALQPVTKSYDFLNVVRESSRASLCHAVPWDQLLSHLDIRQDFPNHPIFDVMVTFHENSQGELFPLEGTEFVPTWATGAKFKLMVELTATKDGNLTLRLEYSDEIFTEASIELVAGSILKALEGLVIGHGYEVIVHHLGLLADEQNENMPLQTRK